MWMKTPAKVMQHPEWEEGEGSKAKTKEEQTDLQAMILETEWDDTTKELGDREVTRACWLVSHAIQDHSKEGKQHIVSPDTAFHQGDGPLCQLYPQPPAHNCPTCCRTQSCPRTHFTCLLTVRVERHLLHWQLPASVSIVAEINFPKSSSSKQLPQPPVHRCLQSYRREERVERRAQQEGFSIRVHLSLQNADQAHNELTRAAVSHSLPRGTITNQS